MSRDFIPGWSPELAERGRESFASTGRRFFAGPRFEDDNRPLPAAFSLSSLLKWTYDQGQVGSCFANMGAYVAQLMMQSKVAAGFAGPTFNPSRRLIWYQCRKLDGSLGSWSDGGSIVNSFAALGPAPHGVGDCSEEDWPYKPSHSWLEQTPPAEVVKRADALRLTEIAELPFSPDAFKRSIFNGHPVGIGIDWCDWDQGYIDQYGRTTGIGRTLGGHAVTVTGWIEGWDGRTWYEIHNSHGKIYPPPPEDIQRRIANYKYNGFAFWCREDMLADRLGRNFAEACIGADVTGFVKRELTISEGLVSCWTDF